MIIEDLASKLDHVESGLTRRISDVEKNLTKKIESEIDGLAVMTKRGFDATDQKMAEIQEEHKKHFSLIENNQADLKLRQDNVAYRFELNALEERVSQLEKSR